MRGNEWRDEWEGMDRGVRSEGSEGMRDVNVMCLDEVMSGHVMHLTKETNKFVISLHTINNC